MEKINISKYYEDIIYTNVKQLKTFNDRLKYYIKDNFDKILLSIIVSQLLVIATFINMFRYDDSNVTISNAIFIYITSSIMHFVSMYFSFVIIRYILNFNCNIPNNDFKIYYIFNIRFKAYLNRLKEYNYNDEIEFYKKNYDLLFFKKENGEFKIKHLVDFIKNNQYTLNNNELLINNNYHLVNSDNLEKYVSKHNEELTVFKQNIDEYYLSGLTIQPYVERVQFEIDYKSHDEDIKRCEQLQHFKENLKIKKED